MSQPLTYKDAGVDIDAGEETTRRIRQYVKSTANAHVLSETGSFGGLFRLMGCPETDPVLVSSVDGVGTKMKVAAAMGRYDTVGHDIVNHCVNDILVQGARPLFFLDYIGANKVLPGQVAEIVKGISEACLNHNCCLIGGETAEMPDVYGPGDIDLVGTIVGVVERNAILDGSRTGLGDRLIGLASSGLHTNGYTLARKALGISDSPAGPGVELLGQLGGDRPLGDLLLAPHRSYFKALWPLLEAEMIHAMAHITGGGIPGNLCRVIPAGLRARVDTSSWKIPPLFELLAEKTQAPKAELFRAFNMGTGMILCVDPNQVSSVIESLSTQDCEAWEMGEIVECPEGAAAVVLD